LIAAPPDGQLARRVVFADQSHTSTLTTGASLNVGAHAGSNPPPERSCGWTIPGQSS
jgi:hypothetical protein